MRKRSTSVLLVSFFAGLLGLNIILFASAGVVAIVNPYDPKFAGLEALPNRLGAHDLIAAKYYHALDRGKPYDVGLFGNSRSAMVSRDDFRPGPNATFYNFSIGGMALIQSVTLLEELVRNGVAPKTAILSLDHPELQFIEFLYFPEPILRPLSYARDIATILREGEGTFAQRWSDAVKVFKWARKRSWARFREIWNVDTLRRRIGYIQKAVARPLKNESVLVNRIDGSYQQRLPAEQPSFASFSPGDPAFRAHNRYVFISLKRLAVLERDNNIRIIVYESPLAPEIMRRRLGTTSPQAEESRRWFLAGCRDSTVECVLAPMLTQVPNINWPDCCHAPARVLGRYLEQFLNNSLTQ